MSTVDNSMLDMDRAAKRIVRSYSGLFLAQGVIMTLLGIAAVIWPHVSTLAVDVYVGWFLLVSGLMSLGMMIFAPNVAGFVWSLLTGALAVFAGILLAFHPVQGVASLTLVLVAFFICEGIFQIAGSLSYRGSFPGSWGWMLASGIADLILAYIIISGWPGTAAWALGLIVGVNLISSGVATIVVAAAARGATEG